MTISRIALVCGALAGVALAQGGAMNTQGGNPQATSQQQQQPAGQQATQQQPAQQEPAAATATQTPARGAQQAPAQTPTTPVKRQPQAKTQDEYKAYQEAAAKPDPTSLEQAANDFATKYPTSELRSVLFQREMTMYQASNNAEKTIEAGKKVIAIDPDNSAALVTVALVIANKTRDNDLDRDERMAEASKYANHALEAIDNGTGIPAGTAEDKIPMFKELVRSMAYSSLGTVEFNRKNYPQAETYLRKSVENSTLQPDPVTWLQLSLALDRENKYSDALQAANKCIEIAQNHPAGSYCAEERDRLAKLAGPAATTPK
jgi:tetratricopeptide (TPR) repeat protein